jgi:hypothetical protein
MGRKDKKTITQQYEQRASLEDLISNAPEPSNLSEVEPGNIVIHFLQDGFTAFGTTWLRGQVLEVKIGSAEYNSTLDREGDTWLDLAALPDKQTDRWGKQMFGEGPWPFPAPDRSGILDAEVRARFERADAEEARRAGRVPTVPTE